LIKKKTKKKFYRIIFASDIGRLKRASRLIWVCNVISSGGSDFQLIPTYVRSLWVGARMKMEAGKRLKLCNGDAGCMRFARLPVAIHRSTAMFWVFPDQMIRKDSFCRFGRPFALT